MSRPFGLHAALGFFTILPVSAFSSVDDVVAGRAIRWFGVVGALLGGVAAAVACGALWCGASGLLAVVLGLLVLTLLTGGLHLDGVADTADGLGSRKPAAEALAIMKQSDIGPMGVGALVFVVLLQVSALTQLADFSPVWLAFALITGPVWGRVMMLEATMPGVPMAPTSSFGQVFAGVTSKWSGLLLALAWMLLVAASSGWLFGVQTLSLLALGMFSLIVAARLWRGFLVRRFGGMTGDLFGSLIEGACTLWWVLLALTQAARLP